MTLLIALLMFFTVGDVASAPSWNGGSRGEMLYATHCSACHSIEIHWREKKQVGDWGSLVSQVRRWQASIGLHWSNEEITEVASYLSGAYYGFKIPARKGYSEREKIDYLPHQ